MQLLMLNTQRLEDLRRLNPDLLVESLTAWNVQLKVLPARIKANTMSADFEKMHEALHLLLGISSSTGAVALTQFIKTQVYPAVDKGFWPEQEQWLQTIENLSAATVEAIKDYLNKSLSA